MGVRKLFAWVKRLYPYFLYRRLYKSITVRRPPPGDTAATSGASTGTGRGPPPERRDVPLIIRRLKIDCNALLHPAAQWTYGYGEFAGRMQGIPDTITIIEGGKEKVIPNPDVSKRVRPTPQVAAQRLIDLVEDARRKLDPTGKNIVSMYWAIDGPAPFAKGQQQRTRRFLSAAKAFIAASSEDDEGEVTAGRTDDFDSAVISPGTPWMDEVDEYLRAWFRANIANLPQDTQYWSHRNPGEGEHKLIATSQVVESGRFKATKHIRDEYDVIYGNDNDLIILALIRTSKTLLYRDPLDSERDLEQLGPSEFGKFILLDIDQLRSAMERSFDVTPTDFSIIALLLGNDFVPTTPVGLDVYNTLEVALKLYKDVKRAKPHSEAGKKDPTFALLTNKIRWDDLYFYIAALVRGDREPEMLAKVFETEEWSNSISRKPNKDGTPLRRIERTMSLRNSVSLTAQGKPVVDVDKFRDLYWQKVFPGLETAPEQGEVVLSMVDSYLQTIVWSSTYYTFGVPSINVEFYYPYYYAPTLVEVRDVLRAFKHDAEKRWEALPLDKSGRFLNPLELLVAILPLPILNKVLYDTDELSPELKDKVFTPLRDLYPEHVDIDGEGNDLPDRAVVRLPFADAARVRDVARTLKRPDIAAVERLPFKYPFAEQQSGRTKTGRIAGQRQ